MHSEQFLPLPRTVDDAHDLGSLIDFLIEDQVVSDRKHSQTGSNVKSGDSHAWQIAESLAVTMNIFKPAFCSRWIVLGNVKSNGPDVGLSLRPESTAHD